ncbi:MAG TPA: glycosyltransferase family 39 protein, partial [Anaerolineae bacterium]|nr:glycosyltransferase family 39 protein [Anaerolineae bacterium]
MKRHGYLYAGTAILLLAGALRLAGLDRTGIEIDEAFSVQLAALSPADIVRGTVSDLHPPLYYLLLHAWIPLAGKSVFAVRLLSALLGWVTVALLLRVGHRAAPAIGLLAAALLAISPPHLWYSQQARQYALLTLLVTASTWLAWRWWSGATAKGGAVPVLYVLTTLAALYTHAFAFLALAAQTIAAVVLRQPSGQERWRTIRHWLTLQALVLVGFAPWLPVMVDQSLHHSAPWIPPLSWPVVRSSWIFMLLGRDWAGSLVDYASALLGLGLFFAALWPTRWHPQNRRRQWDRSLVGWIALWLAIPILLVLTIALFTPVYQNKQLLIVVPALALLLAAGCLRPAPRFVQILLALTLATLMVHARYEQYVDPYRQSWEDVTAYLDAHASPGDLLYLNAAAAELAIDYYLESDLEVAGYPADFQFDRGGWYGDVATPGIVQARLDP